MLDPKSIAYSAAALAALLGLVLMLSREQAPQVKGVRQWQWGAWLAALALALAASQGWPADLGGDLVPITGANTLMLLALGLLWQGVAQFRGRTLPAARAYAPAGLAAAASMALFVALPQASYRLVVVSLLAALVSLWAAWMLLSKPPKHLKGAIAFAGFAFVVLGLVHLGRIVWAVLLGLPAVWSEVEPTLFNTLSYLLGTTALLATLAGVVLCTNAQVFHDVHRLVSEDELTGAVSRRGFNLAAPAWIAKHGLTATALVIDMDKFKQVNDQLGHAEGDVLLKLLTDTAHRILPKDSLFARMGGDEFVALLPYKPEARRIAQELGAAFEKAAKEVVGERMTGGTPTLTIGTSSLGSDLGETLKRADAALYAAKEAGRNQVIGATQMFGRDALPIMSKTGAFPIPALAGNPKAEGAAPAAADGTAAPMSKTQLIKAAAGNVATPMDEVLQQIERSKAGGAAGGAGAGAAVTATPAAATSSAVPAAPVQPQIPAQPAVPAEPLSQVPSQSPSQPQPAAAQTPAAQAPAPQAARALPQTPAAVPERLRATAPIPGGTIASAALAAMAREAAQAGSVEEAIARAAAAGATPAPPAGQPADGGGGTSRTGSFNLEELRRAEAELKAKIAAATARQAQQAPSDRPPGEAGEGGRSG
jgi:diguanylate cyclase (GGDEF)-like protein